MHVLVLLVVFVVLFWDHFASLGSTFLAMLVFFLPAFICLICLIPFYGVLVSPPLLPSSSSRLLLPSVLPCTKRQELFILSMPCCVVYLYTCPAISQCPNLPFPSSLCYPGQEKSQRKKGPAGMNSKRSRVHGSLCLCCVLLPFSPSPLLPSYLFTFAPFFLGMDAHTPCSGTLLHTTHILSPSLPYLS